VRRHWGLALLLIVLLVASAAVTRGAHKPHYKGSIDTLDPGEWEAHFVWLRSDYFNYMGEVWWEIYVEAPGRVDVHFFDLPNFAAFRKGTGSQPLLNPLLSVSDGAQSISKLTGDLPYFLVLRNPGTTAVRVTWTIFAEIDWRRWQGEPPGPEWNLTISDASPPLGEGGSWETTFTERAVYVYHCQPHPHMTGIVEVVESTESPNRVNVTIDDMGFHPEIIRVPVGTAVNWTNLDSWTHSVNLGLIEGGFVIPQGSAPVPLLDVVAAVAAVLAGAIGLVVLRWKRRQFERTSKMDATRRTESDRTNKDK
jgi:plastocyanin